VGNNGGGITIGGTSIIIQGSVNDDSLAQLKAQQAAYERGLMQRIDARLAKTR